MIGLDTSFIVAFEIAEHSLCSSARAFASNNSAEGFALAPQVLCEFIHVVTDPRRFEAPLPQELAIERANAWWIASEVRQTQPTDASTRLFLNWMKQYQLGRKRILDTMLAATYIQSGVGAIAATDLRDFGLFPGVHPVVLRTE